jgi:hypothetical protein
MDGYKRKPIGEYHMSFFKRGLLVSLSTAMVAVLLLLLRASPVRAQVQNLCLQEIDGVIGPADAYGNISTEELCSKDIGGTGSNNSWQDLTGISAIVPAGSVPNPSSGKGTGGAFSGVLDAVPDQLTSGTKILDGIDTWQYGVKAGGPSKADLLRGAVATYTYTGPSFTGSVKTNDEILYYLVTRNSNNGDELHGVWLFLGPVSQTNPLCTSKCTFTGHHTQGDLYLLSGFTGGGGTATIQVFQWSCTGTGAACDSSGSLTHLATGDCALTGASGLECGVVNDEALTVPSSLGNPNLPPSTPVDVGLFYNGGIDVTNLNGGVAPCFSSVMFQAISSASCSTSSLATSTCTSIGNADAKFFIFGNFNTCSINVDKSCGAGTLNASQTAITYPIAGLVSNGDGGTLSLSSITDSPSFDPSTLNCFASTAMFNSTSCTANDSACSACEQAFLTSATGAPAPEACPGASLNAKGTSGDKVCYGANITNPTSTCVGAGCTDTVTASATGPGGSTIPSKMATATCSFSPLQAGLTVNKNCQAGLAETGSYLEVKVNTAYRVSNEEPATLSNVTLTDTTVSSANIPLTGGVTCPTGATGFCLAPEGPGDDATATGSYVPTSLTQISGIGTVPACVGGSLTNGTQDFLSDTVTATGQCSAKVCAAGTGCTSNGTTVTCTAMTGASCPLCPLQPLTAAPSPTE